MSDSAGGFFEMRERLSARPKPAASPPGSDAGVVFTPASLTRIIEQSLKRGLPGSFLIRGELSNFSRHRSSGHFYFTLKDSAACVDCVMFASRADAVRFDPKDGLEVIVTGTIGVYAPRGRYQVYANRLEPVGQGALELAKRQLETKLRDEGLLEPSRKRPIPRYPRTIAIVSSPQAAGFADILKVLRRFRFLRVLVFPVAVQGSAAAPAIAYALRQISERHRDIGAVDLVLLARGGGSLEDLWAFNEEIVARAVAASSVPIVTGIGHEVDVSIADLVADHHAHTPTEAATVAAGHWRNAVEVIESARARIGSLMRSRLRDATLQMRSIERHERFRRPASILDAHRQHIDDLETRLRDVARVSLTAQREAMHDFAARLATHRPTLKLRMLQQRLADLRRELDGSIRSRVDAQRRAIDARESLLRALGPTNVLKRGYSITTLAATGRVVRSASELTRGDVIVSRFADDEAQSTVADAKQGLLFSNVPKK